MTEAASAVCERPTVTLAVTAPSARAEAEERSRGGSPRLLAELSHDLRAPLASLRLLVEGLSDGVAEDERRVDYLAQMESQISLLTSMVDDLHAFSRLHSGDPVRAREAVDPDELIERAVETMRIQAEAARVILESHASPGLPAICANRLEVHRVLVNLIENAIRHTDPGGRIALRAHSALGRVEIEIEDDGEGIPAEDRGRVFRAFDGRDREGSTERSGLGLAIARATVEAHHGRLSLDDSARGARFRISLPAATPHRRGRRRGAHRQF